MGHALPPWRPSVLQAIGCEKLLTGLVSRFARISALVVPVAVVVVVVEAAAAVVAVVRLTEVPKREVISRYVTEYHWFAFFFCYSNVALCVLLKNIRSLVGSCYQSEWSHIYVPSCELRQKSSLVDAAP